MGNEPAAQAPSQSTSRSTLFGLPRSVAGAFIGIVLFLLIYFTCSATGLMILTGAWLAPGFWANLRFESTMNKLPISDSLSDYLYYAILYVTSAIPPAIFGSLFVSTKKEIRMMGIGLFIMYFMISSFAAWLAYIYAINY